MVGLTVDWEQSRKHCVSVFHRLTRPTGVTLATNITAAGFCAFEVNISRQRLSHPDSLCCTRKLKVNSTYWPHLERPLTCAVSHPVWTWWHTEILIIPPLLRSEEVQTFLGGLSRCQVYSFSPRLLMRWQIGLGLFALFFFSMCLCLMRGLTSFCRHGDVRAVGDCHGYRVPFWSAILSCSPPLKTVWRVPIFISKTF